MAGGISPWVQGQTSPLWLIPCSRDTTDFDLTNQQVSWISVLFYNANGTQGRFASYTKIGAGTGTVIIIQNNPGLIQYAPAAGDTSGLAPGLYAVRVEVLFGGTNADYSDYIPFTLQA